MDRSRRQFLKRFGVPALAAARAPALLSGQSRRPNVLWIMSDEQRPDSLGCYGSRWAATPHLDQLAREGVLFENAYTPSPVCVPARCSLLTGRYGSTLDVLHNLQKLRADTRFLTWHFERNGYRTASFGKKHYFYPGTRQAFQTEAGRAIGDLVGALGYQADFSQEAYGAVQYPDTPRKFPGPRRTWILGGRFPGPKDQTAESRNIDLAIDWLSGLAASGPFFLRLSLNAPHTPVVVPEPFLSSIDPAAIDLPFASETEFSDKPPYEAGMLRDFQGSHVLTHEQILKARHYYYARVAFLDSEIGRLVDWMDRRGLLENTIVVFTSDHGAHLGDHGLFQKQTFYEQVARVPYLFWWRALGRPAARFANPVSTLTLLPTLLELAGIQYAQRIEAPPLAAAVRDGRPPPPAPVFSEIKFGYQGYRDDDRLVMVRDGAHKLIVFQDPHQPERFAGRREGSLYNLLEDPNETKNLFPAHAGSESVTRLRNLITAWDRRRLRGPEERTRRRGRR